MTFGSRLKSARTECKMTQRKLAESLGVKHNAVSNWENDISNPGPETIELICKILNVTPNYLLSSGNDGFSPVEKVLVENFRSLDNSGREEVQHTISRELERVRVLELYREKLSGLNNDLLK